VTVLSSDSETSDLESETLGGSQSFTNQQLEVMPLRDLECSVAKYGRKKGSRTEMINFLKSVRAVGFNAVPADIEALITAAIKSNQPLWESILLDHQVYLEHLFEFLISADGLDFLTKEQVKSYAKRHKLQLQSTNNTDTHHC